MNFQSGEFYRAGSSVTVLCWVLALLEGQGRLQAAQGWMSPQPCRESGAPDPDSRLPQRSSQLARNVYLRLWEPKKRKRNISSLLWKNKSLGKADWEESGIWSQKIWIPSWPPTRTCEFLSSVCLSLKWDYDHLNIKELCRQWEGSSSGKMRGSVRRWIRDLEIRATERGAPCYHPHGQVVNKWKLS